ncbi:transcriptional regulator, XRE family with cupin sensor [Nitratireductor aquibiodomus]|uniref:Transcriptional regulator, XRE family with cupin sensor n=1 Tax=Nitratireductor aquibiodomus TaxID=204799 RepID=A0A1H4L339_9HYPH|nr:cupin domain-containing protein [Nitratireductor aquibiodomus]SEB65189.1 transcriptional regulator, XRE family with cupin sensor [Nitratireductor aquibiodomus]
MSRSPPPGNTTIALSGKTVTDQSVGAQIRHLRQVRGLSLRQLAAKVGLSVGHLSQIERGVSSASVRTLAVTADALKVGVSDFFSGDRTDNENIVTRVGKRDRVQFGTDGLTKDLLTANGQKRGLDLFLIRMGPDDTSGDKPYSHCGLEAGYVLKGGFELEVEDRVHILGEGDACAFESTRPHRFRNAGQRETVVLWANFRHQSAQDEKRFNTLKRRDEINKERENLP